MHWRKIHRAHPEGRRLFSRHYSCPDPNAATRQFVKPGSCLVLMTEARDALWVTAAPIGAYVKHFLAGAWECSVFRNEGPVPSSELITEAVALTLGYYGEPPELGMVTFVDPRHVPGYFVRTREGREMQWGYSFRRARFRYAGWSKGGLCALQLLPRDMPEPLTLPRAQRSLFDEAA